MYLYVLVFFNFDEYKTTTFSVEKDEMRSKGWKGYIGSAQRGRPYRPPYFFTDPFYGCGTDNVLWKPEIAKIYPTTTMS